MNYGSNDRLIIINSHFSISSTKENNISIKIFDDYRAIKKYKNLFNDKYIRSYIGSVGNLIYLELISDADIFEDYLREESKQKGGIFIHLHRAWENYWRGKWEVRLAKRDMIIRRSSPLIMGVLNVTPDSFYDGNRYYDKEAAIQRAFQLEEEGADIIDIGGQSTRPGSQKISPEVEMERVIPVIQAVKKNINIPISIDTYYSSVAEEAIKNGAEIINDTSALTLDDNMINVAKKYDIPIILMHYFKSLQPMPTEPYYNDVIYDILLWLQERINYIHQANFDIEKIIIDPGIGFGKLLEHNLEILNKLDAFRCLGRPVLIGPSRKSFIGKILLDKGPDERLEGTIVACILSILKGASIIRVHDVKEIKKALKVALAIIKGV